MEHAIALWGNASCFEGNALSYDSCCVTGQLRLFDPVFGQCRNPLACQPRACRESEQLCCWESHPLTVPRFHRCMVSCEDPKWHNFLRVFRLARGCIHCMGRLDMLETAQELMRSTACQAGRAVAAFSLLVASAVGTAGREPVQAFAFQAASVLLEQISLCKLSSEDWWRFSGISDVQMQYVLAQMEPVPFLHSSFVRFSNEDFQANSSIIDVGAGGFGDTLHFLARQMRVLAVDARPFQKESWMKRLPHGRLKMLSRAVTAQDGGGMVPVFLDLHGQGLMTSLNGSLVPGDRLEQVLVPSISCYEILAQWHHPVVYMKVDVEGHDLDCISSLAKISAKTPKFFSIELPADKVAELVQGLGHLGYSRFKIVRQRLYNLRLAKGQRYAASGPFGHPAVDFLRGAGPQAWRSAQEISVEVLQMVAWERRRFLEWFDLHATGD